MAMNGNGRWTAAEREAGLRALTESAHGGFTVTLIGRGAIHDVIDASMRGDDRAQLALQAINEWLKSNAELAPGENHQCLLCKREFVSEKPRAFAVITPFARIGPCVLVNGICAPCAHATDDLPAAVMEEWRAIWPGLQWMKGGHA